MIILFTRTQKLARKIAMIGSVGKSLTLYGHTVVVIVRAAALVLGTSSEPVARIHLSPRLCGEHLKHSSALGRGKHRRLSEGVFVPVVKHPAVVIALAYLQRLEVGVDVTSYSLGLKEVHGCALDVGKFAGRYLRGVGGQILGGEQLKLMVEHSRLK